MSWNTMNRGLIKCSKLLDQRKQANFQWMQNLRQTNGDNLNNVRREISKRRN
jgi:hypothetical protein